MATVVEVAAAAAIVVAIADVTIAIVTVAEIGAMIVIGDRMIVEVVRVVTIAIIAETIVTAAGVVVEAAAVVIGHATILTDVTIIEIGAMVPERLPVVCPCPSSTQAEAVAEVLLHWSLPICCHNCFRLLSKLSRSSSSRSSSSKHRSKTGLWHLLLVSRESMTL